MEAQNFFGFDASGQDDDSGEGIRDEEYDALNDETFGAAVGGDWETNHDQYANFSEAQRSQRQRNQQMRDGLGFDEVAAGLERLGHPSSSPMNIMGGYHQQHHHHQQHNGGGHMGVLGGPEIAGSPSSIWAPSPSLDKLISPVSNQPSSVIVGSPRGMGQINQAGLGNMGLPSIKTVAELEDEMKLQQHRHNASTDMPSSVNLQNQPNQQPPQLHNHQQQQFQQQQHQQQQQEQFGLHRQGSFNGIPNRNNQFNNRQQRPFGNQGNYQGGPQQGTQHHAGGPPHHSHNNHHPQQQQQQQRFINNFPNNKGPPFNHHNQFHLPPPPPHHHMNNHHNHHGHHGSNHDGFNNFNNQHHNYHNNHHHNLQQQQHPMHHSNRNGDGRYFNYNGYDQGRNGNGFDRRNFDRRTFEQNDRFEQGKNHFDQREYGNGRDHNHLNNSSSSGRDQDLNNSGGGHPSRVRRDSEAEWDEWQRLRDQDDYTGLMTPREKSWLKNIQAMQLHTDSPYQDDYYHVMYSVKQQRKREEEVIEIDGLQLLLPDRGKDGGREYEPPRLENSLGKLQVVSVNAPRKIVDLKVVHLDPKNPTTELQREMRRHRHLLLHIEKMYNTVMEIDDLERKIRLLPDCPTRDLFKTKSKHMACDLWSVAVETPDRLVQLLSVRKGKSLMSHLMSWLGEVECEQLVVCACQNLSIVAKRDIHDQYLAHFWPGADRLLTTSNSHRLMRLAQALLLTPNQGHKSNLCAALSNKFGMSIVVGLLVRGEELHTELEKQTLWQEFLAGTILALTDTNKPSDSTKSDLAVPLASAAVSGSPRQAWQHLGRCGRIEAGSLKVAQEKLSSLDVSRLKAAATSPSPSQEQPQHIIN